MAEIMKALQVTAPKEFQLVSLPIPKPGPGQVLMRIEAVTTCPQWDLHLRHNDPMFVGHSFHYPYTVGQPGHEATGEIVAVGPDVVSVAVGDRVSAWKDPGHSVPGCYAQFVVHQEEHVIKVPDDIAPEGVASVELAMCLGAVFLMLKDMDVVEKRTVGITGLGPAGLIAAQMAKAEGAMRVVGLDLLQSRREFARAHGFDAVYDPAEASLPTRPGKLEIQTGIDCVGAKASVEYLMDITEDAVALFGVQREDYTFSPRHFRGLRLCGYKGHSRAAAEYAVDLIAKGKLNLQPLITHNLPLESYNEGIELLERQEALKICFWPWKDR